MGQPLLPERTMLQIAHHGIKLCHTVRHGRSRGKDRTLPAGQLVHILALHEHIRGLLRLGGGKPRHIPHFRVKEQILKSVCLVHKEPIHAKLLKGYHIVLAFGGLQLLHPRLQRAAGLFQLLDGEALAPHGLHLGNGVGDLVYLLLQDALLPLGGYGYLLELAVADDNAVIVPGRYPRTEFLAVGRLKILFSSHQYLRAGIEPQELAGPLEGQVVRHNKEGLLAQPQPLRLHSGGRHLKGLARAHFVRQQGVPAVKHMGDGPPLVFPQGDVRVHAAQDDVAAVILTGAGAIKQLVVGPD